MNVKDLMIGDLVHYRGTNIQVTSLYDKGGSNEIGWGDRESTWVNGMHIEPIPITKEILERNGFKLREGCTTAWDWHDGETSVHIDGDDKSTIWQRLTIYVPGGIAGASFSSHRAISELKIRGIHELQQALRICKVKKEIKL